MYLRRSKICRGSEEGRFEEKEPEARCSNDYRKRKRERGRREAAGPFKVRSESRNNQRLILFKVDTAVVKLLALP